MVYSPWGGERVRYNLVTKQHMIIVNILLKISPSISCFFLILLKCWVFFLVSVSNYLFFFHLYLVYRNIIDICISTMYPGALLNLCICYNTFFCR